MPEEGAALLDLVDTSQTRAIGLAIQLAVERFMGRDVCLPEVLDDLDRFLALEGLDSLSLAGRHGEHPGRLALPRRYEIAARRPSPTAHRPPVTCHRRPAACHRTSGARHPDLRRPASGAPVTGHRRPVTGGR